MATYCVNCTCSICLPLKQAAFFQVTVNDIIKVVSDSLIGALAFLDFQNNNVTADFQLVTSYPENGHTSFIFKKSNVTSYYTFLKPTQTNVISMVKI